MWKYPKSSRRVGNCLVEYIIEMVGMVAPTHPCARAYFLYINARPTPRSFNLSNLSNLRNLRKKLLFFCFFYPTLVCFLHFQIRSQVHQSAVGYIRPRTNHFQIGLE